jgi:hypothetical protein
MYMGIKNKITTPLPIMTSDLPMEWLKALKISPLVFAIQSVMLCGLISKYSEAQMMVWSSIPLNLSTRIGHDSLSLTACETKRPPNARMIKMVIDKVITMARSLFILRRTKKTTIG